MRKFHSLKYLKNQDFSRAIRRQNEDRQANHAGMICLPVFVLRERICKIAVLTAGSAFGALLTMALAGWAIAFPIKICFLKCSYFFCLPFSCPKTPRFVKFTHDFEFTNSDISPDIVYNETKLPEKPQEKGENRAWKNMISHFLK